MLLGNIKCARHQPTMGCMARGLIDGPPDGCRQCIDKSSLCFLRCIKNRSWCLSEQQFVTQTIHTDLRRTFFQLTILSRRFVTEICSGGDRVTTSKYNSIIEFRFRDERVDHPRGCCYYFGVHCLMFVERLSGPLGSPVIPYGVIRTSYTSSSSFSSSPSVAPEAPSPSPHRK